MAEPGAGLPVGIVTDSMADLPPSWVAELGIVVVPLHVLMGSESLRDGVDITHEAFFRRLREAPRDFVPRTSHPSPADFVRVYQEMAGRVSAIVSLHASVDISATYRSAVMAAREFTAVPVYVEDTRLTSMGEGLVVREAALAARAGHGPGEVIRRARQLAARVRIKFTVETLEYLRRNGRIGRAQAWVGGMLQLKPVLAFEEGVVTPVERVRGRAHSLRRLAELVEADTGGRGAILAIVHADCEEEARQLEEAILRRCQFDEVVVTTLGATIGTHAGPGALGAVYVLQAADRPT